MPTLTIELPQPHAGQQKVIDGAKRFNVLECGRRFGKSTLGIDRLIETALQGDPSAWFAPSYKLLADIWRLTCAALAPLKPLTSVQEKRIELLTGGSIEFWSLDQPDAGRGRKYKRVIIDEAGIVRNLEAAWTEAIRPTLADLKGDAWFLGTPKGHNFFHRLFARGQSNQAGWASWRLPTTTNPTIDPEEIESARQDMPEAAFKQEFLGIPADDGGNPFGLSAIAACERPTIANGPPAHWGVDLAKSVDWSVACALNADGNVCSLERWQSDWAQTTRRVGELVGKTPALIDSTGVGDPIVEQLQRGSLIEGFKFTSQSKQQLMEGLAAAIQRGQVTYPVGWLRAELESFEYQYTATGVRYSAPDGLHDDGVCALALAVMCRSTRRPLKSTGGMCYAPPPRK